MPLKLVDLISGGHIPKADEVILPARGERFAVHGSICKSRRSILRLPIWLL